MDPTEIAQKLRRSAIDGDENQVAQLLASGIAPDLHEKNGGRTPLDLAVWNNHPGAAKILLSAGADPNATIGEYGETTPLRYAAPRGMQEMAQCLLDAGAHPDGRLDTEQTTPLMLAAGKGDRKMAELLLKRGASPDLVTEILSPESSIGMTKITAISSAAEGGHLTIVQLLLEKGAQPDRELLKIIEKRIKRTENAALGGSRENFEKYFAIKKLIEQSLKP